MAELANIRDTLKNPKLQKAFESICPSWMKYDAEVGFAVQAIEAQDPDKSGTIHNIAVNKPRQLAAAMYNVAACGLSLDPSKKEAYLTVRRGSLIFDPSYIGMCRLATDTGSIMWVQAETVKAEDNFRLPGVDEKPVHERDPFKKDRGETVGYYCVVKVHNGDYLTTAMAMDEINKIKNAGSGGNVWKQWPDEMGKKSVIRRAHKLWPASQNNEAGERLAKAVYVGDINEGLQLVTSTPELGEYSPETKAKFDQLVTDSDAIGMAVLKHSTPDAVWTSLYHSFDSAKGKYQKVVDALYHKGESMVRDYVDVINEAVAGSEDITEHLEEMGELRPLVEERVSNEASMAMRAA